MNRKNTNLNVVKNQKENFHSSGITLIALIITIVIMLILAGITINLTLGSNGIFQKAKLAKSEYEKGSLQEKAMMEEIEDEMAGLWNEEQKLQTPKLGEGMTPVKWNEETSTWDTCLETDSNWYNYLDTSVTGNENKSKWANATTADGSYWVWIPRYEYDLDLETKTVDVKFIPISQREPDDGYTIHPAFRNGIENGYANGEWDRELTGIWVAKYEMSNNSGTPKSAPNVSSWRYITIGNSYAVSYNMNRTLDSHLIKNSEWGAVAYLAHSNFGRNGVEISVNNANTYITGHSSGSTSPETTGQAVTAGAVDLETTADASTTGNVYGIYDLSGGAWERTATFFNNPNRCKGFANMDNTTPGGNNISGENFAYNTNGTTKESTKYATRYDSSDDKAGDAIRGWFSDCSYRAYSGNPFFLRGGYWGNSSYAGLFASANTDGDSYLQRFVPCGDGVLGHFEII